MEVYLVVALFIAGIGSLPFVVRKRFLGAGVAFGVEALFLWFLFYKNATGFVGPLGGVPVLFWTLLVLLLNGAIVLVTQDSGGGWDRPKTPPYAPVVAPPVAIGAVMLIMLIAQSGCFNDSQYANLIGPVEQRVWTQDVQPKDPRHIRMSTSENADAMATKAVGAMGNIGSQFQLEKEYMTLQKIGREFWYVAPFDYASWGAYRTGKGVTAYIMVHGEDPRREAVPVHLADEHALRYTPNAFFSFNLKRHLRTHGFLRRGITDYTFEIDDEGNPWWVVTVYEPTVVWTGDKVTGVAIVNPKTGDIKEYPLGKVPEWIDRAVPASFVKQYLTYQGTYANGWSNQAWPWSPKLGLTEPEEPSLIYGEGDQPEFVVGITSTNEKDDSLIALVYVNSRTGKAIRYEMKGGATDSAVLAAVNSNPFVKQRQLHGVDPQLLNVIGRPTSVVPLFSENHAFQGTAMVDIRNVQIAGVGTNQFQALRDYERVISENSGQVAVERRRVRKSVTGVVERSGMEMTTTGTVYYVYLKDVPHIFTAGSDRFHELPLIEKGAKVRIEFNDSTKDTVSIEGYDDFGIKLGKSEIQENIEVRAEARRDEEEETEDVETMRERILSAKPEDIRRLGEQVPPKQ